MASCCQSALGNAAVRLDLPAKYRIHNTFHVSLVKPYRADGTVQLPPPVDWLNDEPYWSVERILSHRDKKEGRRTVREYLVKWTGYGDEHNSWVPDAHFTDHVAQDQCWAWVKSCS